MIAAPPDGILAYRPDIDGLRAIAVIGVVLCHARLGFPGGYAGVDVFLVISGYLITGLIHRQSAEGSFSLARFWERRARRIAPALFAVCLATSVAAWFTLLPEAHRSFGKSLIHVVAMISNIHFNRQQGYFAPDADQVPLLHTWSLAVEEQFYIVIPLIVLALTCAAARAWTILAAVMSVAFLTSLGVGVAGVRHHSTAAFYLMPARAWELLAGALLVLAPRASDRMRSWRLGILSVAGIGLIVTAFIRYDDSTPFPGLAAIAPVAGACLVIWAGSSSRPPAMNRWLAGRLPVGIGLISYSLYLWHWPMLVFARMSAIAPLGILERAGLAVASLPLAYASWRFIELPWRTGRISVSRGKLAAITLATAALALAWGAALVWRDGFPSRLPDDALRFASATVRDKRYFNDTAMSAIHDLPVRFGDPPADLLVWGDSHAMAILPAIEALCAEHRVGAYVITHASSAPLLGFVPRGRFSLGDRSPAFAQEAIEFVRKRRIRTVILAAVWRSYASAPEFVPALRSTIAALSGSGVKTYFMRDVPAYRVNVPLTLALCRWKSESPAITKTVGEHDDENAGADSTIPFLLEMGVTVLDPVPFLRAGDGSDGLLSSDSGGAFYLDNHHLSSHGALVIRPLFEPAFTR